MPAVRPLDTGSPLPTGSHRKHQAIDICSSFTAEVDEFQELHQHLIVKEFPAPRVFQLERNAYGLFQDRHMRYYELDLSAIAPESGIPGHAERRHSMSHNHEALSETIARLNIMAKHWNLALESTAICFKMFQNGPCMIFCT
ncbi:hypothetical protein IG631_03621 [Alternaria alternata]|nr:hypothetical protein IG631_03621 [Alternaria alternata]